MGLRSDETTGAAAALKKSAADVGTALAQERTDLAVKRSYLAADRTLMAWIRTTLSMIGFGFTIGKLGQVLKAIEGPGILGNVRTISLKSLAFFLVILGVTALLAAALQFRKRVHDLRKEGLERQLGFSFYVAIVLVLIGLFALTSLALSM